MGKKWVGNEKEGRRKHEEMEKEGRGRQEREGMNKGEGRRGEKEWGKYIECAHSYSS